MDAWSQDISDGKGGNATLKGAKSKKEDTAFSFLPSVLIFLLSFNQQVFTEFLLCDGHCDRIVDKETLVFVSQMIANCVKQINLLGESNLK